MAFSAGVGYVTAILIIAAIFGAGFAMGYLTRDRISKNRRRRASGW
jgi:hypothetical protein